MSILLALKSLKADWISVVTSTSLAVVILVLSYVPIGQTHPWVPWLLFVLIWSISWGWTFVRSWNREHSEVERLKSLLLHEYVVQVRGLHKSNIVWNVSHERQLFSEMNGDEALIRQAIQIVKSSDPNGSTGLV